jgi:hypothetical protein
MVKFAQDAGTATIPQALMHPHPPKPRLTLRVGITGHRPNKLDERAVRRVAPQFTDIFGAIDRAAADILRENASVYAETAPAIRLISGFAEGADQMAVAACPKDWRIEAILPFPKDEYLKDFEKSAGGGGDVRGEFEASLAKAAVVTELPFPHSGQRNLGYVDAGGYLLRQIDLLVAVWDGLPPNPGGTGALAKEAVEGSIPVVWLSTRDDRAPRMIKDFKDGDPVMSDADCTKDTLTAELMPIFEAPPPTRQGRHRTARAALDGFYSEHWRPLCRAPFYDLLKRRADGQKLRFVIRAEPYEKRATEWDEFIAAAPPAAALPRLLKDVLVPRHVWADALAVHFSHLYRSAYVLAYLLSAIAVFVALGGMLPRVATSKRCWLSSSLPSSAASLWSCAMAATGFGKSAGSNIASSPKACGTAAFSPSSANSAALTVRRSREIASRRGCSGISAPRCGRLAFRRRRLTQRTSQRSSMRP